MKRSMLLLILCICLYLPLQAQAETIYVESIPKYAIGGDDMDGMEVTVNFDGGGTSQSIFWTTGIDSGAASGSGWSLSFSGTDTYSNSDSWLFYSDVAVSSFTINAISGFAVFDILSTASSDLPDLNTEASSWGWWSGNEDSTYDYTGYIEIGNGLWYEWTFSNPVALSSDPDAIANGDVWGQLEINFVSRDDTTDEYVDASFTDSLEFYLDTDHVVIPEPTTIVLFGFGLLGLGALGRKKVV